MNFKVAPLKGSFMMLSVVGLVISFSVFQSYPSWGFAFMLIFTLMFIASLISMTYAPLGSYDLKEEGILKGKEKK